MIGRRNEGFLKRRCQKVKLKNRHHQSFANDVTLYAAKCIKMRFSNPQYITNNAGKKLSVVLPFKEYERMIEELEEKDNILLTKSKAGRISKIIPNIYEDKSAAIALKIESIQTDSKIYLFKHPVLFQINKAGKSFIIENEQLDLFAAGQTQDEAEMELYNQFEHSYQRFNELADKQLSAELLNVKTYYNLIVKKIVDR